jgi:hypothetical protein
MQQHHTLVRLKDSHVVARPAFKSLITDSCARLQVNSTVATLILRIFNFVWRVHLHPLSGWLKEAAVWRAPVLLSQGRVKLPEFATSVARKRTLATRC